MLTAPGSKSHKTYVAIIKPVVSAALNIVLLIMVAAEIEIVGFTTAAFGNLANRKYFDQLLFCCYHNGDYKIE